MRYTRVDMDSMNAKDRHRASFRYEDLDGKMIEVKCCFLCPHELYRKDPKRENSGWCAKADRRLDWFNMNPNNEVVNWCPLPDIEELDILSLSEIVSWSVLADRNWGTDVVDVDDRALLDLATSTYKPRRTNVKEQTEKPPRFGDGGKRELDL